MSFRLFCFCILTLILPINVQAVEDTKLKNEVIQGILKDFQNMYFENPKHRGKEFFIIIKDFDLGDKETYAIIDKEKRFWIISLPEKNDKYVLKGFACCEDYPLGKVRDELVTITRKKRIKQKFTVPAAEKDLPTQTQKGIAEAPKQLKAIVPPGNDINISVDEKTVGRRVEVPSKVRAVIDQVARRFYGDHCPEDNECVGLKLYGPIFRLKAPQKRELFIFTLNYSGAAGLYHFVMYDPVTKNVTQKPPSIDNKWIQLEYSDLKKPIISFEDLGQDGHHELSKKMKVED